MRALKKQAFTLVELLVVITILAIISVVAYQNFWWAVDKAVSGRKISDVSTIETALQQYKADNNFFPPADLKSDTNFWGYTGSVAYPSNTVEVSYDGQEIQTIHTWTTLWWGQVFGSGTLNSTQIGSKWTISQDTLGKKYLTKDLYDPEIWDIIEKDSWDKFIDKWVWRYVYAIYKKASANTRWNDYNIAYTIKKENSDAYVTKITWSYDSASCYDDEALCPETLIGSGSTVLQDGDEQIITAWVIVTDIPNQWIPYPVNDFTAQ